MKLGTTAGNVPGIKAAQDLVEAIPPVAGRVGRLRRRPDVILADGGYDSTAFRDWLRSKRIEPIIPQRGRKKIVGLGRIRWVVEQAIHQDRRCPHLLTTTCRVPIALDAMTHGGAASGANSPGRRRHVHCEPTLSDADIVDFFGSTDAALEALEAHRAGVLEFYVAFAAEAVVFGASDDEQVRLYRVPWLEAMAIDLKDPLPRDITEHPAATCTRGDLIDHLKELRREFACAAIESDPRLASHEPLRRWSLNEHGRGQDA